MDKKQNSGIGKNEFTLTIPLEIGKSDVEQLAFELENTKSSFLAIFIENLLKKTAEVGCDTEVGASNINAVNPFGVELHSPMEIYGLEAL